MELCPWEAASCAATQEVPKNLLYPKVCYRVRFEISTAVTMMIIIFWEMIIIIVCYRVHKSRLLVPVMSQINPIHTILSCICKIHFNISHEKGLRGIYNGFWSWWSNVLNLYTTYYNISQIAIFDWTLSTSGHTTSSAELSVTVGFLLYSFGSDHTENTLLPSNGYPLLLRIRCRWMCLPSRCIATSLYVLPKSFT
jgi:hypothetical protein